MNDDTDVLVVGTGYLGQTVAQLSHSGGAKVYATTRHQSRFDAFRRTGFHPIQFDWTEQRTFANLPLSQCSPDLRVLVAVSYDSRSRLDRYQSQVGGLRNLLRILPSSARVCYISTTGVYHQTDGGWVDETAATRPDRLGGRVHLQAESLLHRMRPRSPWNVLRLAGIYGPGRVPRVADVIAGRPIESAESGYLNLIHVRDAARAVIASWQRQSDPRHACGIGMQSRLYLVADDRPVLRREFYREIARRCHAPMPRFLPPSANASARMRSDSNKRVWNRKLRRELLPALDFPDHSSGLADVLRSALE